MVLKLSVNKEIGIVTAIINHKSCTNDGMKENDFDNASNSEKCFIYVKALYLLHQFSLSELQTRC